MKNTLKINHKDKTIVMDRTFAKLAENTRSEEYAHLQNVRRDYPDYQVIRRKSKKNPGKKTYHGLTYEYMLDYIVTHVPQKEKLAATMEFNELLLISRCQQKGKRYPTIKMWFLEKYSEVAEFELYAARSEEKDKESSDFDEAA